MSTTARNRYRPGLGDLIRREWYMTRLDWGLRNLPTGEGRRILRDLRRDVTATASETGMREALAGLGDPGILAEGYTGGTDAAGPRYGTGAMAAGAAICIVVFLLMAYAIGTLDTLQYVGGGTRIVSLWWAEATLVSTTDEISLGITNLLPALGVLAAISAVVFLLFSRIWRLGRSR
ncbi:MAG: hypothetical protein Q4P15_12470 [Propionibacteriaceae bacterium]|nr:hypothetical protein [Propionibacteriaceae bacterium]